MRAAGVRHVMAFRSGHRDASAYAGPAAIFTAPYARLDDTALLRHFSTRRGPHYAPVCEPHFQSDAFVADVMRDRYRFNGETFQLDADFDWTWNPSSDIEWLIMLQKCYHFAGMGLYYERSGDERIRDKWMTLADRWLMQVEPGFIASDVAGRRIQNWIYAFHCFVEAAPQPLPDAAFVRRYLGSLHAQTAWLHNNLTASRNHRTLELHAIFLVALVFPELRDSPAWLEFALSALAQNVSDDFLADGVHCEQSIFYHHVVLRNLLNVQRLAAWNGLPQPAALRSRLRRALRFSLHVHRPDGVVPAFSDGDNASFLDLLESAADLYDDPELGFVASGGRSGRAPRDTLAA
ncbi:MAG: heparinase II/III family protein, partial [Gammaproteobacteria bacterium]